MRSEEGRCKNQTRGEAEFICSSASSVNWVSVASKSHGDSLFTVFASHCCAGACAMSPSHKYVTYLVNNKYLIMINVLLRDKRTLGKQTQMYTSTIFVSLNKKGINSKDIASKICKGREIIGCLNSL